MAPTARDAIQRLVDAQHAIDQHDSEFSPAPWHLYSEATDGLADLEEHEREAVVGLLDEPYLRVEAAHACGVLKLQNAVAALLARLRDPEPSMRDACAAALIVLSPETALRSISDAGTRVDRHVVDRAASAAIEALGADVVALLDRIGHPPSVIGIYSTSAWDRLYGLYRDVASTVLERRVRGATFDWVYGAQRIVLQYGGGDWVLPAFSSIATHPDTRISRLAADVLAKHGDATSIELMLDRLRRATHPWERLAQIKSIFVLGRATQTPVASRVTELVLMKADEQRELMLGLTALGEAQWETDARSVIASALRAALQHSDEEVVAQAIRATTAQRLESLAADVIGTLVHRRYYNNAMGAARDEFIAWAPGASTSAFVTAIERGIAESADEHAVELAARALARVPSEPQRAVLFARAFACPHHRVRDAAETALRTVGMGDVVNVLFVLATSGTAEEAREATRALQRARSHPDARLGAAAAAALQTLEGAT